MIENLLKLLETDHEAAVKRLCDLLRIASVSTDAKFAGDCRAAADWIAGQLRQCGLRTQVHDTQRHPIVLGHYDGAGEKAPRLLFYGHYDVQPPDPVDKWTTPPFEPSIRQGRLYARGSSDDKGQVMCFIEALRAWKQVAGKLPINVTIMIEGEEECGSVSLDRFIVEHKKELAADIVAVSDTAMWDRQTPSIVYALRGLLYMDIQLHGPDRDLHSGVYGGSVSNPATELMRVLGRLFDDRHAVAVPGFYDDVLPLSPAEQKEWEQLHFSDKQWAESVGLTALYGEAGFSTLERRWARPSCDINGLYGGYMGEGAKTVIPSFAGAKVSFRLAANQDPVKIETALRKWLEGQTPPGCRWKIQQFTGAYPVSVPTDSPWLAAAKKAVERAFGRPPVLVREGASIPVVATFKKELGLDTLLIGFGLNDDNLHSPNEKFELDLFLKGCQTHAALLHELSGKH